MTKLSWIKKRVRMYEFYKFAPEKDGKSSRRVFLAAAIEDYAWTLGKNKINYTRMFG